MSDCYDLSSYHVAKRDNHLNRVVATMKYNTGA